MPLKYLEFVYLSPSALGKSKNKLSKGKIVGELLLREEGYANVYSSSNNVLGHQGTQGQV